MLREHLSAFALLPSGPVEVIIAWRGAASRNWVSWWKPTGDSMGPVLGEPLAGRPYYPNDDRIVVLEHHWLPDASAGREIGVRFWWRSVGAPDVGAPVASLSTPNATPQPPKPDRATVIDGALEVACKLGADEHPVSISELFQAYSMAFPERAGQTFDSFAASLNFHCVNMQSRFPKPQEPKRTAGWMTRPLFKRVSRGAYQLLTQDELAWFRKALAEGDEMVFRAEYTLP